MSTQPYIYLPDHPMFNLTKQKIEIGRDVREGKYLKIGEEFWRNLRNINKL